MLKTTATVTAILGRANPMIIIFAFVLSHPPLSSSVLDVFAGDVGALGDNDIWEIPVPEEEGVELSLGLPETVLPGSDVIVIDDVVVRVIKAVKMV